MVKASSLLDGVSSSTPPYGPPSFVSAPSARAAARSWIANTLTAVLALLTLLAVSIEVSAAQPNASTANPAASADTVKVLAYLRSLSSRRDARVLSGQNVGHANLELATGYQKYHVALRESTGLQQAILGIDYGSEEISPRALAEANKLLIRHWKDGGLVTISISPANPMTGGGLRDRSTGGAAFSDLYTKGTKAYEQWHRTLAVVADGLTELRDAGVVVLWRPLHEANGDFFWWSAGSDRGWARPEEFRAMWQDMFEFLTRERKLNNLLWVFSSNFQSNDSIKSTTYYYPGDQWADIVGMDYYDNTLDSLDARGSYSSLVALGKPFALTEVGPAFWWRAHPKGKFDTRTVIEGIRSKYPATTYFMFWQGWSTWAMTVKMGLAENLFARELLTDPWVVTQGNVAWRQMP